MAFLPFPRSATHQYELAARRGRLMEAQVTKAAIRSATEDLVRAYRDLMDISGRARREKDFFSDQLRGLRDELTSLDHEQNVIIDDVREYYEPIDLGELDALIAKVS